MKKAKVTAEQIKKLPVWAQDYIQDLALQRASAIRALEKFNEANDKGAVIVRKLVTDTSPPTIREARYDWHNFEVRHLGVELGITLREDCITLQYGAEGRALGLVYCTPVSYQQFELRATSKRGA